MLMPLPATPYELAIWKIATVQFNYHISVDKMHYSASYEYIKHKVDVRLTRNVIEVFFNNHRICSHPRLHGRLGQYSTVTEHMPEDHKKYIQWNSERFISWAESVGPSAAITVKAILSSHKVEQQGYRSCMALLKHEGLNSPLLDRIRYRSCMALLKLADKFSIARLEAACSKALSYTPRPGYQNIKTILTTGHDRVNAEITPSTNNSSADHGFTRGAEYYGRNS